MGLPGEVGQVDDRKKEGEVPECAAKKIKPLKQCETLSSLAVSKLGLNIIFDTFPQLHHSP